MIRSELESGDSGGVARCWLVVLLALALSPTVALAHAKLARSEPKANSTLAQPPKLVELWFTEELKSGFNTIEVKDAEGRRVDSGEVTLAEGGKKAQVEITELGAGAYTVVWRVLSADEHTIRGRFTFKVTAPEGAAAPAATPSPENALPPAQQTGAGGTEEGQSSASAGSEETPITWVDSLVRWLAYLAMMTIFGGFVSRLFVLGPVLRQVKDEDKVGGERAIFAGARRTVLLFWTGLGLLFPMLLAALVFQSSAVNIVGLSEALAPAQLSRVITKTGFGTAWLITTLAAAALAVIVFFLNRSVKALSSGGRKGWWWAGLAASALMLFGPSLTGHAMAAAGEHHFAVVSDWLHLVASGFWVGGLFHLALAMPPALSHLAREERTRALGRAIRLFTRVAIPSVIVVFLAGLYNSWIHVGGFGALWNTSYGRTLIVKLLLILPMLALGARNGFRYGPMAERLVGAGDDPGRAELDRDFRRSVKIEAAFGVLVLLVASFLVFATPARNDTMRMTDTRTAEPESHGSR